ncbi:MAG: hypothetical protein SGJ27_06650 [Candidatus Melainabacteria bacterium]|nr:hypothetical protein [Candidatus Melainabacteria bacterium]
MSFAIEIAVFLPASLLFFRHQMLFLQPREKHFQQRHADQPAERHCLVTVFITQALLPISISLVTPVPMCHQ